MNTILTPPDVSFSAECPECQRLIRLQQQPRLLQLVNCSGCDEILVVTALNPPRLDWALDSDLVPSRS